jgi:inner membrane protein
MANPFRNSIFSRLMLIAAMAVVLLIGVGLVQGTVDERQGRRAGAEKEVVAGWGTRQVVRGPSLSLPYLVPAAEKKTPPVRHTLHLLPEHLRVSGELVPEVRYIGIYEFVLYRAKLQVEGDFTLPDPLAPEDPKAQGQWNEAYLQIGIDDLKGIRNPIVVAWNDTRYPSTPGMRDAILGPAGVTTAVPLVAGTRTYRFSFRLDLNGAERLLLAPVGRETTAQIRSDWPSPSFHRDFLPEKRRVDATGFDALWRIFDINRGNPQQWLDDRYKGGFAEFGVSLIQPVDHYQQSTRALKYALLFIIATFLAYFIVEVRQARRIHPIQYLMIGAALVVFYVLLLAISEHFPFAWAFLAAAGAVTIQIGLYSLAVLRAARTTLAISTLLATLYGLLYVTLILESYSLLVGAGELFLLLTVLMFLTRRVDWYGLGGRGDGDVATPATAAAMGGGAGPDPHPIPGPGAATRGLAAAAAMGQAPGLGKAPEAEGLGEEANGTAS